MKKIKFMAKPSNGVIVIPKKYQKILASKVAVILEYEEMKRAKAKIKKVSAKSSPQFKKMVTQTMQEYSDLLKKLAKE